MSHPLPRTAPRRPDPIALRNEGRAIERLIHRCTDASRYLSLARDTVDSITASGDAEASLVDARNNIDDAIRAVKAAAEALDGSITNAMDEVL